jgi:hypothetical protein
MVRTQTQAMLKSQPKDRQIIEQEATKFTMMQNQLTAIFKTQI